MKYTSRKLKRDGTKGPVRELDTAGPQMTDAGPRRTKKLDKAEKKSLGIFKK